ncbi:MAG: hypothetical protein JWM58_2295 [Rhizobium sp.]|nr:hypothetical protein [Rhizobium sp.]
MNDRAITTPEQVEQFFDNAEAQFPPRSRVLEEHEAEIDAREAKTLKLREMRLAKEESDRAAATSRMLARRAGIRK